MSSGRLSNQNAEHFRWHDHLTLDDYVVATYSIETVAPIEEAAVAIAREQSAPTLRVGDVSSDSIIQSTARVLSVENLGEVEGALLSPFHVQTRSYPTKEDARPHCARIRLAFPPRNSGSSCIGLWNSVAGEVHRLGFLTAVRVDDLQLPRQLHDQMPGPLYGVAGIRRLAGIKERPLFCRAARPATGLSTEEMVRINESVLRGGFDAVKDDELTYDTPLSPFRERVVQMMNMLRRVEDATGERKFYFANVIDDPFRALEFADHAAKEGVSGLITAPALQGLMTAADLGRRTGLLVISHNVGADLLTRAKRFGINPALWCRLQRWFGADFVFVPGNFGIMGSANQQEENDCIAACTDGDRIAPCMPILAGGKRPDGLRAYHDAVGSTDFMLIASTVVDENPKGLEAGASAFRDAWQRDINSCE
jgi:ribulose-bisphosphate carboxylase large chain